MKVDDEVLGVLDRVDTEGPLLRITEQLERPLYVKTNKVLEAAGGRWDRRARAHVFPDDAAELLEPVILTGEITHARDEFGYFPTPPAVVDRLIALADLGPGMTVLEPSAGQGALAAAAAAARGIVDCVELLDANAAILRQCDDYRDVTTGDFLAIEPVWLYDRVVMNPPFARQADVVHVTHALRFLRPGGRLVSVMSAGVTFRSYRLTADLRELIADRGGEIIPLPADSFKESGTGVNTVIVVVPG